MKLELLRMSLQQRLAELYPDVNSNNSAEGFVVGSPPFTIGRTGFSSKSQYSAVDKAAALTGTLHIRSVSCPRLIGGLERSAIIYSLINISFKIDN